MGNFVLFFVCLGVGLLVGHYAWVRPPVIEYRDRVVERTIYPKRDLITSDGSDGGMGYFAPSSGGGGVSVLAIDGGRGKDGTSARLVEIPISEVGQHPMGGWAYRDSRGDVRYFVGVPTEKGGGAGTAPRESPAQ